MSPIVGSLAGLSARSLGWGLSAPAATFELIQTQVLASSAASVTFSLSAGQQATYKHLQLRIVGRGTLTQQYDTVAIYFNGDTAANYAYHFLNGASGAAGSGNALSQTSLYGVRIAGATASTSAFAGGIIDILDAQSTSKNKVIRALSGHIDTSFNQIILASGVWFNTAALTSITATMGTTQFVAGSRLSLYGVRG